MAQEITTQADDLQKRTIKTFAQWAAEKGLNADRIAEIMGYSTAYVQSVLEGSQRTSYPVSDRFMSVALARFAELDVSVFYESGKASGYKLPSFNTTETLRPKGQRTARDTANGYTLKKFIAFLKAHGITQAAAERMMGYSAGYLYHVASGEWGISAPLMRRALLVPTFKRLGMTADIFMANQSALQDA